MQEGPIGYSVRDAARAIGVPVSTIWILLKERKLDARRCGRRNVILATSLRAYVEGLPPARPERRAA
jgi:hypothetical protein